MVDTRTKSGKTALVAVLAAIGIGVLALVGWFFHIETLKSVLHGTVNMNPATVLAMILAGTSLGLSLRAQDRRKEDSSAFLLLAARVCALVVTLIGLLRLAAIFFSWDIGVDQWLFPSQVSNQLPFPSRMAPNVALNFLLLGSALLLVDVKDRSVRFCVEFSVAVVGFGALLAVLGYAYNIQSFYRLGDFIPMALPAAIAFSLLSFAFLLSHTDNGLLAIFAGNSPGGRMARSLLPAAILVPAVLGWITLQGEEAGIYHGESGEAIFAVGNILIFAFLVCWSAKGLFNADLGRKKAEEVSRESEEKFRQLAENISDVFWMTSPDFAKMYYISPAYEEIWGRSMESLYADPHQWVEAILPEERERVFAVFTGLGADESSISVEYQISRPDGTIRWLHDRGFVVRDVEGRVIRIAGIASDITERKQAEEELNWKTAFLEAQVNSSIDGILVVDQGARKSLQNQRFVDLLKIPKHIADETTDENRLQWVTDITKNPKQFVEKVRYLYLHPSETSRDEMELKDGTILDRYSSPVIGKDGRYYGRIWTFRDITERKQTENALRESDEKFHQLADNITDSFWIRSPDLREVHYISPAFERIWGRSLESLYANPDQWADFILPEDRERALAAFATLTRDTPSVDIAYRIVRPGGEIRWVHVRGFQVHDAAGKLIRLTGIVTDITERKRTEEIGERLAAIVENSNEAIISKTLNGIITSWNPAAEKMFGYTASEIIGQPLQMLIPPDHPDEEAEILAGVGKGQSLRRFEAVRVRKDGQSFDASVTISPIKDADGKVIGISKIVRDITDRKQLEAQLLQSQKMETVGKLAGGIAHEFNSILTAIIGQSELLLGDLPAESPLAKNVTEITKAAGRAASLTRQLLAYGRKQLLQPEILDLNQVIASMEGMFHHLMGGGVDTQIVPAPDLHAVKADAGQIEQVIMNMAINAGDAMPNGGKLILETANVSFDQESVGRYPELKPGDYVMLAITDTGTGISPEVKARVFEPFFSTKDVGRGTGLGLSTCYGIIKQSGGHISVYSELARGTTFKIYLPQVEQQPEIPIVPLAASGLPGGTETILLVEDDPALREMAATLLRRLGYTILSAANGVEALTVKQQRDIGHIDLLFTDVVMPHMSGKELADRVRALFPHTKILFTSAYTENAIVHQGVLDKGVALLQKPFTPAALAGKIREVLNAEDTVLVGELV